jgi:hypothetical protein
MKLRQIAALALLRLVADDASPQDLHTPISHWTMQGRLRRVGAGSATQVGITLSRDG